MANEKLLICDDEPGMLLVLTNVLKPQGYTVLTAEDGAQTIEAVKSARPHLLLLDMRLPDMDGLEILAEVKKINPNLPVVMLSGFADVESAVGAMKQGAFDYLSKPFRVEDVRKVVLKALGNQALAKEGLMEKDQPRPVVDASGAAVKILTGAQAKKVGGARKALYILGGLMAAAAVGAGLWLSRGRIAPSALHKDYTVPYANPTGVCYTGDNVLWVTDWVTSSVYKHNVDEKLSVAQIIEIPGGHPTGVTWDGVNLWTCNSWERSIYKHAMDNALSVAATYPSPGPEPAGLYWDGVNLWVCDYKEGKFYRMKVSEEGLTVLNAYDAPGPKPVGIFATADAYWSADAETNRIYKHAKDEKLTVQKIYTAEPFQDRKIFLSGLGWDGKTLWFCADESNIIHRNSVKNLTEQKL